MSGAEALDGALGELLHVLCELVDLAAGHVVGLAVVPNQLNVRDHVVEGHVLPALEQRSLDRREVHRTLHDLWVVQQAELFFEMSLSTGLTFPLHWLQEGVRVRVLLDRLEHLLDLRDVFLLDGVLAPDE